MKTEKEIYEFVKGHYYSDLEEDILWQPFEDECKEEIEEQIQLDIKSLKEFIGIEK